MHALCLRRAKGVGNGITLRLSRQEHLRLTPEGAPKVAEVLKYRRMVSGMAPLTCAVLEQEAKAFSKFLRLAEARSSGDLRAVVCLSPSNWPLLSVSEFIVPEWIGTF